ncbi:MAG: ABC transporter permease [Acetobacteraceae bacterium]
MSVTTAAEPIGSAAPTGTPAGTPSGGSFSEDRLAQAGQLKLTWLRFKRHKLAFISLFIVGFFYLIAIFADFIAISDPHATDARRSYIPPQGIHFFDENGFAPHVYGLKGTRDMKTFKLVYAPDPSRKLYITLFAHGYSYDLFGLIPTDRHLIGLVEAQPVDGIFLLGTDQLGRDLFSRLAVATRISLSIGLASVGLSLILGILLGGLSGLYGGFVDTFIQRVIEIIRSIPTIPLWMGIAAALPNTWSVLQVYFAITIIISLIGWTELARVVRGRFLALREEDFVIAAELAGAGQFRIMLRHMLPSFTSHVIAAVSLALPAMIISETSLSFLGLGLRPPAISWGILLQDAQNVQVLAGAPWLLMAAVPVVLVILAFNFLGDGLRDAADPYG